MGKSLPPVGKVANWLEAAGFEVSYLYEDLIFVESNAFLIRFEQSDPQGILIYTNSECEKAKASALVQLLLGEAKKHELMPVKKGPSHYRKEMMMRLISGLRIEELIRKFKKKMLY